MDSANAPVIGSVPATRAPEQATAARDAAFVPPMNTGRDRLFDAEWLFHRGDATGAHFPDFDDTGWRTLDVPHDWSVENVPVDPDPPKRFAAVAGVWRYAHGDDERRAAVDFDDSQWASLTLPGHVPHMPRRTYAWLRREVAIPPGIARERFLLCLGRITDCDEVYLNGERIGGTGVMPKNQPQGRCIVEPSRARAYWVMPSQVRAGSNLIAVCIYSDTGRGGVHPDATHGEHQVIGPFSSLSSGGTHSGYTVGGIGWYRKHFTTEAQDAGKRFEILFDGVYMNSDVWINGHHVGFHAYGYTAFYYDLTDHINPPGRDNVIAVRVNNEGVTSRWYSGSGVYRHVWLSVTERVHIRRWGVHVTTPVATPREGVVELRIEVQGDVSDESVRIRLRDADGGCVAAEEVAVREGIASARIDLPGPELWSTERPYLYMAEVSVLRGQRELDRVGQSFGIRTIAFSVENGFQLNGETMKMIGGCVHHDNGLLGATAFDRAEIRKVHLLKENGYNAVRCSHNTMSEALLDACDRAGILVMDETFDQWYVHKTPQDYGGEAFERWCAKDIELMLRRNRNHPSIVMWSLGNEIGRREGEEARLVHTLERLIREVRRWDTTRPVTGGNAGAARYETFMGMFDLKGYNYREPEIEKDHRAHPEWVAVCAESRPEDPLRTWNFVNDRSWVVGSFVWTAFDYLGESWCGWVGLEGQEAGWPSFAAACGAIDLCGVPKAQQLYRNVMVGLTDIEVLVLQPLPRDQAYKRAGWSWPLEFPSWTWPGMEGSKIEVKVVTRCPEVRLLLNGRLVGRGKTSGGKTDVVFEVAYEAGELRAEGLRHGRMVASRALESASDPVAIRLTTDRNPITADRSDLAYVTVELVDASGRTVSAPEAMIRYHVTGEGALEAAGNGNPKDMRSFRNREGSTWRGRSLAILRPTGREGTMTLTVESPGLATAALCVQCRRQEQASCHEAETRVHVRE